MYFITNDKVLERIIYTEKGMAQSPSNIDENYLNEIKKSFMKNNPDWSEMAHHWNKLLYEFHNLDIHQRSESYYIINNALFEKFNELEEWFHLPHNHQDPIEFLTTPTNEKIAETLHAEQIDGDFTGVLIKDSPIAQRYIKHKTPDLKTAS